MDNIIIKFHYSSKVPSLQFFKKVFTMKIQIFLVVKRYLSKKKYRNYKISKMNKALN